MNGGVNTEGLLKECTRSVLIKTRKYNQAWILPVGGWSFSLYASWFGQSLMDRANQETATWMSPPGRASPVACPIQVTPAWASAQGTLFQWSNGRKDGPLDLSVLTTCLVWDVLSLWTAHFRKQYRVRMIICLLFKLCFSDWISLNHFLSRIEHKVSSKYRNTFSWSSCQVVYNSRSSAMGRFPAERERDAMGGACMHPYCARPGLLHSLRDPHLLPKKPRKISTECL